MRTTNIPYDRTAEGPLITVKKLMDWLDCSRAHAYRLVHRGEFKVVPVGDVKGLRVTTKSVERYLRRREKETS